MKKNKKRNFIVLGIVIVLVACITIMLFQVKGEKKEVVETDQNSYRYIKVDGKDYRYRTNLKTILFLGIDTTDETKNQGQSDAIDLAIFDRDQQKIKIISLSRDTMCKIRLFDSEDNDLGWDKQHLGLAYSYGKNRKHGGILAKDAVSKLLSDVPLVNYTAFDLNSLQELQDIIGDMPMVLDDDYIDINPLWKKGKKIVINRDNVEEFVRSRNTSKDYSNKTRMQRQKLYIQTYINQLKTKLTNDYSITLQKMYDFYSKLTTNITLKEIDSYAEMILNYSIDNNEYYTLPGEDQKGELHDEFIVDQKQLKQLVLQLFYEEDK